MTGRRFQSTRPRGARLFIFSDSLPTELFQSTRPRGARLGLPMFPCQMLYFNPRARVGRDFAIADVVFYVSISIHAPAWGATSTGFSVTSLSKISIHAPAWGATLSRNV